MEVRSLQPFAVLYPLQNVENEKTVTCRRNRGLRGLRGNVTPINEFPFQFGQPGSRRIRSLELRNFAFQKNVQVAYRSKFSRQPFQVAFYLLRLVAVEQFRKYRNSGPQPAHADTHLVHAFRIGGPYRWLIGRDVTEHRAADRLKRGGYAGVVPQNNFRAVEC